MRFTPLSIRQVLDDLIHEMADNAWLFARNPKTDFSRRSKLGFEKTVSILLSLAGKSIANELLDFFHCDGNVPSPSAFVQSRDKLLPDTLEFLFHEFIHSCDPEKTYHGYRLLAVDGSEVQIPTDPGHADSFFPGINGQKSYNLLLLNAMYDLMNYTYLDAVVEGAQVGSEQRALTAMVDRSRIGSAILIADRGFESYNCLAHLQEKGWKFLFRVKNGYGGIAHGLDLPDTDEFDLWFDMHLTRKQTNEMKNLLKDRNHFKKLKSAHAFDYLPAKNRKSIPVEPYHLPFRLVRFKLTNDTYETIITNLDADQFPPSELKELYAMRWGIETSFRSLKYTVGLLHFHAKKVENIFQEIFARLIMYNFSELITSHVIIHKKDRKYAYQANFSAAVYICRQFFRGNVSPPNVETLIARHVSPIRTGRNSPREQSARHAVSFNYRVA